MIWNWRCMNHCSSFSLGSPKSIRQWRISISCSQIHSMSLPASRSFRNRAAYRPWRTGISGSSPLRWRQASPETPLVPRSHRRCPCQRRCDQRQSPRRRALPSRGTWRLGLLSLRSGLGPCRGYSVRRCLPCFSIFDMLPMRKFKIQFAVNLKCHRDFTIISCCKNLSPLFSLNPST